MDDYELRQVHVAMAVVQGLSTNLSDLTALVASITEPDRYFKTHEVTVTHGYAITELLSRVFQLPTDTDVDVIRRTDGVLKVFEIIANVQHHYIHRDAAGCDSIAAGSALERVAALLSD